MIVRRISPPIDRRITVCPAPQAPAKHSVAALVEFRDAWGERIQIFDPQQLVELPGDLGALLVDAFREHYSDLAITTRYVAWMALRRFARFVAQDGLIGSANDLDSGAVGRYVLWLRAADGSGRKPAASRGTSATAFDVLRPLLHWCQRNRPGALPADLDIPYNPFPTKRSDQEPRRRLSSDQLRAILRACYEEIDEVWDRFQYGQEIIRLPNLPPRARHGQGLARWIWRISRVEGGVMPDHAALERHGIKVDTLRAHWGGYRVVSQYFHITIDSLVPFFLAIAIQTAANPDPLRMIKRDCLVPHPLDEHCVIVDWCKPKTGRHLKKAQRRSFDRRRRYAAPNLIEMVLALTDPLVAEAPSGQRDRLFLTRSPFKDGARRTRRRRTEVIDHSTLRKAVDRFIARANARIDTWNATQPDNPRSLIERFTPVLFRGSVATEHYRASAGDVLAAQAILNHASPVTTETYIRSVEATRLQRQTIARLQDLMIAWISGSGGNTAEQTSDEQRATVLFSHDCLAPFITATDGPARLCPRFGGCLTCPGLVIPIDAAHLARILLAIDCLDHAKRRLDPRRWEMLYAPSYRILTGDILRDFPDAMRAEARALAATMPPLPELE
jgi:integrase